MQRALIEAWRPVFRWEDHYQVSSLGRVRRIKPGGGTRCGILKAAVSTNVKRIAGTSRYRRVPLCRPGDIQKRPVHQLVAEAFHGPRPPGMEVRHLDGDSLNNCADNLAWGTSSQNRLDSVKHGSFHAWRAIA